MKRQIGGHWGKFGAFMGCFLMTAIGYAQEHGGECAADADCEGDLVCRTMVERQCEDVGGCEPGESDDDCAQRQRAACSDQSVDKCVYAWESACLASADCGDGFECAEEACTPTSESCESDEDCPSVWNCGVAGLPPECVVPGPDVDPADCVPSGNVCVPPQHATAAEEPGGDDGPDAGPASQEEGGSETDAETAPESSAPHVQTDEPTSDPEDEPEPSTEPVRPVGPGEEPGESEEAEDESVSEEDSSSDSVPQEEDNEESGGESAASSSGCSLGGTGSGVPGQLLAVGLSMLALMRRRRR